MSPSQKEENHEAATNIISCALTPRKCRTPIAKTILSFCLMSLDAKEHIRDKREDYMRKNFLYPS